MKAVLRRFTWLIPGKRGGPIKRDKSGLDLYSLEFKRMRRDLIRTYKILGGHGREYIEMLSCVGESQIRE